mmetsp:Transcript_21000/g.31905  ORF Transcript_21000/g.31905 Transcript_21000/m.31905 type:complete len:223 (-) Transcript_21000:1209-1877(-)
MVRVNDPCVNPPFLTSSSTQSTKSGFGISLSFASDFFFFSRKSFPFKGFSGRSTFVRPSSSRIAATNAALTTRTKFATPILPSMTFLKDRHLRSLYTVPPTGCINSRAPHPTLLEDVLLLVKKVALNNDPSHPREGKDLSILSIPSRTSFASSCLTENSSRLEVCDSVPLDIFLHNSSFPLSSSGKAPTALIPWAIPYTISSSSTLLIGRKSMTLLLSPLLD